MIHEFLLMAGFVCAIVGLALSVWGLWDEIKRRKHDEDKK